MKRKILFVALISAVAVLQISSVALHSNGIPGYTDAPGETNCTYCHLTYPLNSPGGSVKIDFLNGNNSTYVAGQTYTVSVQAKRAGLWLFGLDVEALDSTGANAGVLSTINANTTIVLTAIINTQYRTNVTHYGGVYATDSCTYLFILTAPNANIGNVTFYVASNIADGDGYVAGDYIYTTSLELVADTNTSGTREERPGRFFSLFPNPATDYIRIKSNLSGRGVLNLYDDTGKFLFRRIAADGALIDISGLKEGVYTAVISCGEHSIKEKLIIDR